MARRVVITGLGTVSGLGIGTAALWAGLVEGRSAISRISRFDPSGFRSRLAAEVKNFSVKDYVPKNYRKATKVMARDIELAVGAARLAVEDAGLVTRQALADPGAGAASESQPAMTYRAPRMGCHIGAGLVAAETEELTYALATARGAGGVGVGGVDLGTWGRSGMENLTPLWLLKYLPNMLACHVTILHGAEGPSNTITCAEASGLLSVGESTRVIERGAADLCFSGGAESKINLMGLLRMDLAGRLADTGESTDPLPFLRPYDEMTPRPQGGLLGEGGGIVVLEEAESARQRGARVYAEVLGFGAGHSFGDYEEGESDEGFRFAIEAALENAGVGPEQIDFILPLASGILPVDQAEAGAIRAVFGKRASEIPLVTITPNVGNCMAGIGGLQAAVAAKCLAEQRLPARLHGRLPTMGLAAAPAESRPAQLGFGLVCTGSLGGQNAALVLRKPANI